MKKIQSLILLLAVTTTFAVDSCKQLGNRYTIANSDCTCFRQEDISNGNQGYHRCPEGLIFSTAVCSCTWPGLAKCAQTSPVDDGCLTDEMKQKTSTKPPSSTTTIRDTKPTLAKLIGSIGRFNAALMKQLDIERKAFTGQLTKEHRNIAYSPFSIHVVLAMLYEGARGNTRAQMGSVAYFDIVPNLKASYQFLLDSLNSTTVNVTLLTANRIYPEASHRFLDSYLQVIREFYRSRIVPTDFSGSPDVSRKQINAWVEQQTQGLIKDLLAPPVITRTTVMVLVNVLYFKGFWEEPFNPNNTVPEKFYTEQNQHVMVDMMKQVGEYKYAENSLYQAIALPYSGNRLAMYIILPVDFGAFLKVTNSFSFELIDFVQKMLTSQDKREVMISLPKFKVKAKYDLKKTLSDMGMPDLFGNADLSGMNGGGGLSVSAFIHEAVVDVSEEGTEAAAATVAVIRKGGAVNINVNRPFFFFISSIDSRQILFAGRVGQP